jgi:hypothetical protein
MKLLGFLLLAAGAVGILGMFVLARLELRRLVRAAARELAIDVKPLTTEDVALALLEQARCVR